VCNITTERVLKYTPETSCEKVPHELCAPIGCNLVEGPVQCRDKMKTVIVDNPNEECDLEPFRTCKHSTKLVPKLVASKECVDVPKEVCARSKINPKERERPAIQKWCYKPEDYEGSTTTTTTTTTTPRPSPGVVLIKSIKLEITDCDGCTQADEGVNLTLLGQQTRSNPKGTPCTTNRLDNPGRKDFGQNSTAVFDGLLGGNPNENARETMGTCFEGPLNAVLTDGGSLTYVGTGVLAPSGVCVSWKNPDFPTNHCGMEYQAENVYKLASCKVKPC